MPRISVVMASYNHAAFVGDAIRSILNQTFRDLELIVVDDGSMDGTNAVIGAISDPRMTHVALEGNRGAAEALRIALARRGGNLVAICNSDDVWEPVKLERQVAALDEMPEVAACFSAVTLIGPAGEALAADRAGVYAGVFEQPNRSRFGWMRRLAEHGNCLCHPSVLIRARIYDALGAYNNHLRQLPDFDMWLRLVQHHEIHVMPDRLVRFRLHEGNTSGANPVSSIRSQREAGYILDRFFAEISQDNFVRAFGAADPANLGPMSERDFVREKALYLLHQEGPLRAVLHAIGLRFAFDLSRTPGSQALSALAFQAITGELPPVPHGSVPSSMVAAPAAAEAPRPPEDEVPTAPADEQPEPVVEEAPVQEAWPVLGEPPPARRRISALALCRRVAGWPARLRARRPEA